MQRVAWITLGSFICPRERQQSEVWPHGNEKTCSCVSLWYFIILSLTWLFTSAGPRPYLRVKSVTHSLLLNDMTGRPQILLSVKHYRSGALTRAARHECTKPSNFESLQSLISHWSVKPWSMKWLHKNSTLNETLECKIMNALFIA